MEHPSPEEPHPLTQHTPHSNTALNSTGYWFCKINHADGSKQHGTACDVSSHVTLAPPPDSLHGKGKGSAESFLLQSFFLSLFLTFSHHSSSAYLAFHCLMN